MFNANKNPSLKATFVGVSGWSKNKIIKKGVGEGWGWGGCSICDYQLTILYTKPCSHNHYFVCVCVYVICVCVCDFLFLSAWCFYICAYTCMLCCM